MSKKLVIGGKNKKPLMDFNTNQIASKMRKSTSVKSTKLVI